MQIHCTTDIDECQNDHECNPDATCINLHGGYFCHCNDGYWGNGRICSGE